MEWGKLLALKGHHHIMYKITPNSIRIVYKCIMVVENRWGVWRCVNHAQYRYMKRHLAHPTEAFLSWKQILGSLRMLATVLSNDSCSSSKRGFSFSTSWASLPVCHSSLQSSIIFGPPWLLWVSPSFAYQWSAWPQMTAGFTHRKGWLDGEGEASNKIRLIIWWSFFFKIRWVETHWWLPKAGGKAP